MEPYTHPTPLLPTAAAAPVALNNCTCIFTKIVEKNNIKMRTEITIGQGTPPPLRPPTPFPSHTKISVPLNGVLVLLLAINKQSSFFLTDGYIR